jgi:hypothetical protein
MSGGSHNLKAIFSSILESLVFQLALRVPNATIILGLDGIVHVSLADTLGCFIFRAARVLGLNEIDHVSLIDK